MQKVGLLLLAWALLKEKGLTAVLYAQQYPSQQKYRAGEQQNQEAKYDIDWAFEIVLMHEVGSSTVCSLKF